MSVNKTLAMRVLEGRKVEYEVLAYPDTERDAVKIAHLLGVDAGSVFKTLVVVRPSGKPILVMIPADRNLDLKKMAKVAGEKKVKMAGHQEAESLTGLQVGGISAIALLNRGFAIYLNDSAARFEQIMVSAGKKGLQIKLTPADLVRVCGARLVDATA